MYRSTGSLAAAKGERVSQRKLCEKAFISRTLARRIIREQAAFVAELERAIGIPFSWAHNASAGASETHEASVGMPEVAQGASNGSANGPKAQDANTPDCSNGDANTRGTSHGSEERPASSNGDAEQGPDGLNGGAKGPDTSCGDANGPDGNAKQNTAVAAPAAPAVAAGAGAVGGPSPTGAVGALPGSDRTAGQRDPDVVQAYGPLFSERSYDEGGDAAAADSAPFHSETSGREAGAVGRPYDQILLILDRAGREKARIEAESRREVRAGIEALERALEGRESRVADGKRRRLEAADADASRKIRAVLRAGWWAAEPRERSLSDRP
jgi:hypothetical protein